MKQPMFTVTKEFVDRLFAIMQKLFPDLPPGRGCVYYSVAAMLLMGREGRELWQLQAGSAHWPITLDDAKEFSHVSVVWENNKGRIIQALIEEKLPEMHIWLGNYTQQMIFDPCSGYWPKMNPELNLLWELPDPPKYLLCTKEATPKGVVYECDKDAIELLYGVFLRPVMAAIQRRDTKKLFGAQS